jgi:lipopolysaccharide export system permease protein
MRLLDRYLLRELLVPLGFCLCGFLIFWITSDLFVKLGDFQRQGLGARDIAEYYFLTFPEFLTLVLPIALLLALLYALTNHARHQEITAIRAAGVSLWRMSLPYLGVGFLASLALFATNEFWVPATATRANTIMKRHQAPDPSAPGPNEYRNVIFDNTRDGRRWHIGVWNSETGEMRDPKVYPIAQDSSKLWELGADRARRINGVWTLYNVHGHRKAAAPNDAPVPLPGTNVLAFPEFSETPEEINSEIKIQDNMSLRATRKADMPIKDILNYLRLHPNLSRANQFWLYTKLEGRLAAPWTCLVVVLIAIPFGAVGGRRNVYVGVASSIIICFVYFVLLLLGLALGTSGRLPAWLAAWFPNLAFGLAGLWLTARVR